MNFWTFLPIKLFWLSDIASKWFSGILFPKSVIVTTGQVVVPAWDKTSCLLMANNIFSTLPLPEKRGEKIFLNPSSSEICEGRLRWWWCKIITCLFAPQVVHSHRSPVGWLTRCACHFGPGGGRLGKGGELFRVSVRSFVAEKGDSVIWIIIQTRRRSRNVDSCVLWYALFLCTLDRANLETVKRSNWRD